jgi:hypothetical protein
MTRGGKAWVGWMRRNLAQPQRNQRERLRWAKTPQVLRSRIAPYELAGEPRAANRCPAPRTVVHQKPTNRLGRQREDALVRSAPVITAPTSPSDVHTSASIGSPVLSPSSAGEVVAVASPSSALASRSIGYRR